VTRALVIGRRRPGRKIADAVRETRTRLEAAGWSVDDAVVETKGRLRRDTARAAKAGVDVVVAVGGDGAVLQVVQSLAGTKVALGIIPMGTGNLLAGNLEIPKGIEDAVKVLTSGGRRRIDLGRLTVGGKRTMFAVACGVGFDAEVMKATDPDQKLRLGKLAYVASAIRRQGQVHDVSHEVTLDGVRKSMEATQVLVANFGRMGPAMKARLEVEPDDGLLDVLVIRASGPLGGLLAGWEALRQDAPGESPEGHVFRARARKVRISTAERRLVETDGSVVGKTPIRVSVRPAALTVIVPATQPDADVAAHQDAGPTDG
jgi:YegS/Rv2252/BmrU family lipid kinase